MDRETWRGTQIGTGTGGQGECHRGTGTERQGQRTGTGTEGQGQRDWDSATVGQAEGHRSR